MGKVFVFYLLFGIGMQLAKAEAVGAGEESGFGQDGQVDGEQAGGELSGKPDTDASPGNNNDLEGLLADVEKRYGETAATLRALQLQIEQKHHKIDEIERDILARQRIIAKERQELAGQVKAAYEMGQQETLKLLLNQQDPTLSGRMMIYYSYINKSRMAKIAQLDHSIKGLEQLDQQKLTETALLEQDLKQKKLHQMALNEVRMQRDQLLADVVGTSYGEQLRYVADSENKLKELIASLPQELGIHVNTMPSDKPEASSDNQEPADNGAQHALQDSAFSDAAPMDFSKFEGKLPWPVQGKLVQKPSNLQNGVLIEAKEGLDVQAVAAGKVKFADWMRNYGHLVIIDHGGGYMTLYAFNQSVYKQVNDTVKAGDVIASVGQSGGRNRAGLYFGIRKNALPIDPLKWCRR